MRICVISCLSGIKSPDQRVCQTLLLQAVVRGKVIMTGKEGSTHTSMTGRMHRFGLVGGLIIFALMITASFLDSGVLPPAQWRVAAVVILMAVWWMTEALPFAVTALLPIALFPLLSDRSVEATAAAYAHPLVFLFLGGFCIAKAIERWDLHVRLADAVLRWAPRSPAGIVAASMCATASLSMWISNTATAMVMVPIAQSLIQRTQPEASMRGVDSVSPSGAFASALMLGVAFSATIGGMATLVGTPPNALLAAYLQSQGISVGFAQWMAIGLPVVLVLLPMTWFLLTRLVFDLRDAQAYELRDEVSDQRQSLSTGATLTAAVAIAAGVALVFRPLLTNLAPSVALSDTGIAVGTAILLFILPVPGTPGRRLLAWEDVARIRWDVLILIGGGLALADAIDGSGLSRTIGGALTSLETWPLAALALIAMLGIVFLGELASNTAMAAVFLPIVGGLAVALGIAPIELVVPVGLAASLGFMLPVATPPNAIAYASGNVRSLDMLRAGALLDIISVLIVFGLLQTLMPLVFD
jgi:sodium-dependent dicarboxylate transporter 2/3/5